MVATILLGVGLLGIYLLGSAIYSITLHPLADVPGPKICAITRIPYWLVALRGDDIEWMKSLHEQYGPVVRFGPTDLSYTAAQAWDDVHGPKVQEKAQEFSVQPVNGKESIAHASAVMTMSRVFEPNADIFQAYLAFSPLTRRTTRESVVSSRRPSRSVL